MKAIIKNTKSMQEKDRSNTKHLGSTLNHPKSPKPMNPKMIYSLIDMISLKPMKNSRLTMIREQQMLKNTRIKEEKGSKI